MTDDDADRPDHLDDVTTGGCAELWERTVEVRREDDDE